jgi:hypothetical protein
MSVRTKKNTQYDDPGNALYRQLAAVQANCGLIGQFWHRLVQSTVEGLSHCKAASVSFTWGSARQQG